MDIAKGTHSFVSSVSFGFHNSDEIKKISVCKITNPILMDSFNQPLRGGLYDPALGPFDKHSVCETCSLSYFACPGHFGHIELPVVTYQPLAFNTLLHLYRNLCPSCYYFRHGFVYVEKVVSQLMLLDAGFYYEAVGFEDYMASEIKKFETNSENGSEKPSENSTVDSFAGTKNISSESIIKLYRFYVRTIIESTNNSTISHKSSVSIEFRRKIIDEFIGKVCLGKCKNCKRNVPSIYTGGKSKLFSSNAIASAQKKISKNPTPSGKKQNDLLSTEAMEQSEEEALEENESEDVQVCENNGDDSIISKPGRKYISPLHVYENVRALWKNEARVLDLIFGAMKSNNKRSVTSFKFLFLDTIPVPPTKFRPPSIMNDEMFEHPQNTYLSQILKIIAYMCEAGKDNQQHFDKIVHSWVQLQEQVNYFFDSKGNNQLGGAGKLPPAGIKQILEKKEGLFRKHMMGKRVNYAARTVISPDPNIETNQIGVPLVFAKKLTYPEPVTDYNVKELRAAVVNGPYTYPGASHVQHEDGSLSSLEHFSIEGRTALANQLLTPPTNPAFRHVNKKVYRHLKTGDVLLVNRQPTLHKPSIMAHICRVLPGEKTLRMHYANCNTYNADFDGDEMNIHLPQSETARAEAYHIALNDFQYLAPTDGSPLRGLIQDHIVTAVLLTCKDSFFDKNDYFHIVYGSLFGRSKKIVYLPPSILKPRKLWSGKQIISTLLLNLTEEFSPMNLISKTKIPARMWGCFTEESLVVFKDGELLTGVLDKSQLGDAPFGLVHAYYELYGARMAGELLTAVGRLLNRYLQIIGFTCRMDDLLLMPEIEKERKILVGKAQKVGDEVVRRILARTDNRDDNSDQIPSEAEINLEMEKILRSDYKMAALDMEMKTKTNEMTSKIIDKCLPNGVYRSFPSNNMALMTVSGAKGSNVNFSQISGLLGQQELEGRRVPVMVSGKSLPSFVAFDSRPISGGYITSRFLTGISLQEFYFHCMAGREGLIDTAVKTSRSGYLQRCLIKGLEGLKIAYDNTVRDADGSLIQFYYGEDGLDPCKNPYLEKFDFNAHNFEAFIGKYKPGYALNFLDTESVAEDASRKNNRHSEETLMSKFSPLYHLGCVSDKFNESLEDYIKKNPENLLKKKEKSGESTSKKTKSLTYAIKVKQFRAIMWLKYMNSLADPGESVGLVAAQSIGEPSTQMTLNTFHFAGVGAKNVTLGIPRLREILMTASRTIKTPSMNLPLLKKLSRSDAMGICNRMGKLTLKDILKEVHVKESYKKTTQEQTRYRQYWVTFKFLDMKFLSEEHAIMEKQFEDFIEKTLIPSVFNAIKKYLKRKNIKMEAIEVLQAQAPSESPCAKGEGEGAMKEDDNDDAESSSAASSSSEDESGMSADEEDKEESHHEQSEDSMLEDNDDSQKNEVKRMKTTTCPSTPACFKHLFTAFHRLKSIRYDQKQSQLDIEIIYPSETPKLLLLSIIEEISSKIIVHEIHGISRLFPNLEKDNVSLVQSLSCEGVNFQGVWEYPHLFDLCKIQSNDIHAILNTFGVEAARNVIVNEIASVFGVYGISVDPRHLSLIADYMTFEGGFKPFNRAGLTTSSNSPLLKMSFESTVQFLQHATLFGESDSLETPSSRLVFGVPVRNGTGSFEVTYPSALL